MWPSYFVSSSLSDVIFLKGKITKKEVGVAVVIGGEIKDGGGPSTLETPKGLERPNSRM